MTEQSETKKEKKKKEKAPKIGDANDIMEATKASDSSDLTGECKSKQEIFILVCFFGEGETPTNPKTGQLMPVHPSVRGKNVGVFKTYKDAMEAVRHYRLEPHFVRSRIEQHEVI